MTAEDDKTLLEEYTQWKAEQEHASRDLSPDAFLLSRAREKALDRNEQALTYLSHCAMLRTIPDQYKLKEILNGTYIESEADSGGTVGTGLQPDTQAEAEGKPPAAHI